MDVSSDICTPWKLSKYGVISGLHIPVFGLNTGKYGPEITSHWDTFHAVSVLIIQVLPWCKVILLYGSMLEISSRSQLPVGT